MDADRSAGNQFDRGDTLICACLHRTTSEIREAIVRLQLETFEDVADAILAGSGCTSCRPEVEALLEETLRSSEVQSPPDGAVLEGGALDGGDGEQSAASADRRRGH